MAYELFRGSPCEKLEEEACQKRKDCAAIYNKEFKECVTFSEQQQEELALAENLCRQTGGEWQKTKYGEYCNCAIIFPPKIYMPGKGCIDNGQ